MDKQAEAPMSRGPGRFDSSPERRAGALASSAVYSTGKYCSNSYSETCAR